MCVGDILLLLPILLVSALVHPPTAKSVGGSWPNLHILYILWGWSDQNWWPWPNFQGHASQLNISISDQKALLKFGFLPNCIDCRIWPKLHSDKKRSDFGDLDLIFKGTPANWISPFPTKRLSWNLDSCQTLFIAAFDQNYTQAAMARGKKLGFGDLDFLMKVAQECQIYNSYKHRVQKQRNIRSLGKHGLSNLQLVTVFLW